MDVNVILIGDGGCGKTCLLLAYSQGIFRHKYVPTVCDTYQANLFTKKQDQVRLTVRDTAGQEHFDQIRQLSYGASDVAIMCYDCSNNVSLLNIEHRWVEEVNAFEKKAAMLLVGNKKDKVENQWFDNHFVKEEDAERLKKNTRMKGHLRCSAKQLSNGNVTEVFNLAMQIGLIKQGYTSKTCFCF
eukprot:maker-scaffold_88-snap-gene-0.46-mRNA-1 protein AED:0.18 eAED:0.18 QI:187/1/1/1/1/1/4/29/185